MEGRQDYQIQQKVRSEALIRETAYNHPPLQLKHQPINHRECEQLQKQLRGATNDKLESVKRNQDIEDLDKLYGQKYAQFAQASMRNQFRQKQMCNDIQEMHNMADLLLHPPSFTGDLFLHKKQAPSELKQKQLDQIFLRYQKAYQAGEKVQQNQAQQAIRRAERFLLKDIDL